MDENNNVVTKVFTWEVMLVLEFTEYGSLKEFEMANKLTEKDF